MKNPSNRTVSALARRLVLLGVDRGTIPEPILRGVLLGEVLLSLRDRGGRLEMTASPANKRLMNRLEKACV